MSRTDLSDSELIQTMLDSKKSEILMDLLRGQWESHYETEERAVAAITYHLTWWTQQRRDQAKRMFEKSGFDSEWSETFAETFEEAVEDLGDDMYNPNWSPDGTATTSKSNQ